MQHSLQMHFAKRKDISDIRHLLKSSGLPDADIEQHTGHFLLIEDETGLIGSIGLQIYGETALLRSLAVDEKHRNLGLGKILMKEILQYAERMEVKKLYLLTTTAEAFFAKLSFIHTDRNEAPEAIRSTSEFTSLCPTSAVFMYKEL